MKSWLGFGWWQVVFFLRKTIPVAQSFSSLFRCKQTCTGLGYSSFLELLLGYLFPQTNQSSDKIWVSLSSYVFCGRQRILLFNWRWKCSWSENHRIVIIMLFKAVSSWIFNTFKVRHSTTSLGNLFQGLTIFAVLLSCHWASPRTVWLQPTPCWIFLHIDFFTLELPLL